jgi:hypothetical protein
VRDSCAVRRQVHAQDEDQYQIDHRAKNLGETGQRFARYRRPRGLELGHRSLLNIAQGAWCDAQRAEHGLDLRLKRLRLLRIRRQIGHQVGNLGGGRSDDVRTESQDDAETQDVGQTQGERPRHPAGESVRQRRKGEGQHAAQHYQEQGFRHVAQQPPADHQHRQPGQDDQGQHQRSQPGAGYLLSQPCEKEWLRDPVQGLAWPAVDWTLGIAENTWRAV